MGWGREAVAAMVGAVLPGRCPGCGRAAEPVCATCAAGLRRPQALAAPPLVDLWVAAFAYEGVAREIVARVKYRNERGAVPWLARAMVAALTTTTRLPTEPELLTWVPASAQRRRRSGFDHGELLARAVARQLGRPAIGLLTREPGAPQTGRSRADRGPGPALSPARSAAGPGNAAHLRGATVLLVDDVVTTGATLTAAASALRRAGAASVVAVTAAATPPGRSGPVDVPSDLRILRR